MRIPVYSLRTGILAHLAFLILSAMLLTNVVMVKFAERDLIRARVNAGRLTLYALKQRAAYELTGRIDPSGGLSSDARLNREVGGLLKAAGYSDALIVDRDGAEIFRTKAWGDRGRQALSLARETLATRQWSYRFSGSVWGVIWFAHESVDVSAPILSEGRLTGSMAIRAGLDPIYEQLRRSESVTLLYIVVSTGILLLFGIYLLSRIIIKPIHRLLQVTETFKEGESIPPLSETERNEIGQLSRSLNLMLKRLEENKKDLQAHIASLEQANLEVKKAQAEILRSEKLASVGRLATGVAHEIGNPIGIILGYLELLKREDSSEEEKRDFLNRIESEITRINHIIRQLLDFSRSTGHEKRETPIHELITQTVNIMKPQPMTAHIETRLSFGAAQDTVWADPNQLQQVFLNIILNAADAMEQGESSQERVSSGNTLTIMTRSVHESIEIRFTDTGPGIPPEALAHVFDPFFTTKEPGKGTGLGLSVCYRIIEELGGKIRAESQYGKGATIVIEIPSHPPGRNRPPSHGSPSRN